MTSSYYLCWEVVWKCICQSQNCQKHPPAHTLPDSNISSALLVLNSIPASINEVLKIVQLAFGNLWLQSLWQLTIICNNLMVTLALLHVLPHLQRERKVGRGTPQRAQSPLLSAVVFHRFRHSVWVSLNSLRLRKWLGSQPHLLWPENAKRLRFVICSIWQTQWRVWRGRGLT